MEKCRNALFVFVAWASLASSFAAASTQAVPPRKVISLDGTWQVAQGTLEAVPGEFPHSIPVPGLVDMAQPPFQDVGKKSPLRQAFWYRRTFRIDGTLPEVVLLKVHKARYGTRVFINGKEAGEHLPCFTPALLSIAALLKGDGQENEVVIRVGADRDGMPDGMPTGWDFEKYLYVPGIYDSVELILTAAPFIYNVQAAPDIPGRRVRVLVEAMGGGGAYDTTIKAEVAEPGSGRVLGSAESRSIAFSPYQRQSTVLVVPLKEYRLWSPETPVLYDLRVSTAADAAKVRFGMRSFRFDRKTGRALLNGQPYYLRGTNVCIYRFFEDASRGDRPWRAEWVRRLHRKFKSMHWNSIRYCIGFPPEIWYDIADEEGFLIQDEFPIWLLGEAPEKPSADKILPQYSEWMRERWNHPCVVIWDAQNESFTAETGKALQAVRRQDISNRPWDNGWGEPQSSEDCVEAHPYLFIRAWQDKEPFRLKELAGVPGVPSLQEPQKRLQVPIIINEYAWLWLDRQGNPTCLTTKVYESLLGPQSTTEQRRRLYARYLAALTEFWRCHRECAGVLHFCGLGYSRSGDKPRPEGGATSDHFIDIEALAFEPLFEEHVREAFHPVGLMVDFWDEEAAPGEEREVRVFVINDLPEPWKGTVSLRILREGREVSALSQAVEVRPLGREIPSFKVKLPAEPGEYLLQGDLPGRDGKPIRSLRDFRIRS